MDMAKKLKPAQTPVPAVPVEPVGMHPMGYAIWWYPKGHFVKLSGGGRRMCP